MVSYAGTEDMTEKNEKTILDWTLEYHSRGLCIIPIRKGTKVSAVKWEQYQKTRPTEAKLAEWFDDGKYTSLAVVCGAISGNLAVLDLDSEQRCQWWYEKHAEALPTVKTKKGLHIYFRAEPFCKKNGDEVDLLCEGAYAVLPPSPDKNWIIPLNGELPELDPFSLGLEQFGIKKPCSLQNSKVSDVTERTDENVREQMKTERDKVKVVEINEKIDKAINKTLPQMFKKRHGKVFAFDRELRSMPEYTDADPNQFRPVVVEWHKRALPYIETKEFEETWIDFLKGWYKVKWKIGENPMAQIFERAIQLEPPKIAVEKYPNYDNLKILVSLCRELQRAAGETPFFLSVRTAGKLLNVTPMTVSRWFFLLENDGILKVVSKGRMTGTGGVATRFKYIAN
jgi:hypothetical protein